MQLQQSLSHNVKERKISEPGFGRIFWINLSLMPELKYKEITEAYNLEAGLLINFGSASLQFKRLQSSKFVNKFSLNQ
jgi:hypothetical protein